MNIYSPDLNGAYSCIVKLKVRERLYLILAVIILNTVGLYLHVFLLINDVKCGFIYFCMKMSLNGRFKKVVKEFNHIVKTFKYLFFLYKFITMRKHNISSMTKDIHKNIIVQISKWPFVKFNDLWSVISWEMGFLISSIP